MRLPVQNLADHINNHLYDVRQGSLSDAGWALVSRDKQDLLDKLYEAGIPLGEYVGGKIYRGVLDRLKRSLRDQRADEGSPDHARPGKCADYQTVSGRRDINGIKPCQPLSI